MITIHRVNMQKRSGLWRGCLAVMALLSVSGSAVAQTLSSSYFLESMPMRHRLNPALVSTRGYVSFPGLGNISVGTQSNLSMTTLFYPTSNGGLTTFMNPDIAADAFLNRIKNRNQINADVNVTLFSSGFYAWNGFNTIDISVRSTSEVNLPGSLFKFMKLGMDNPAGNVYQLRDLSVQTDNYVEIGLGHAHPVNDRLVLGGKFKVLLGAGSVRTHIDQMRVEMSQDRWVVDAQGYADVSAAGASFEQKNGGEINGLNYASPGVAGWGLAIDLGMSYELVEDHLTLSAAVTDLGFLSWSQNLRGTLQNDPYYFDGFDNIVVDDPDNPSSFKEQWNGLKDDLQDLFRLYDTPAPGNLMRMLHPTVRVGLEYAILNRKISFGLLSTTRFYQPGVWTEGMLTTNFRPCRWFNVTFSGSATNYGLGWGWLLNFCPKGVNLFLGSDYMITRVTPQWIPTGKASASFCMGLNIPIGRRHVDFEPEYRYYH